MFGARRRMTVAIVAALLAVTVGLGGCTTTSKVAAQVGTRTISAAEVEQAAAGMAKISPELGAPGVMLSVKMRAVAAEQVASSRGVNLDAEVDQALSQVRIPPQLLSQPEGHTFVREVLKADALANKIGKAEFASALGFLTVRADPRYGVPGLEDVLGQNGVPLGNGSLSIPAS